MAFLCRYTYSQIMATAAGLQAPQDCLYYTHGTSPVSLRGLRGGQQQQTTSPIQYQHQQQSAMSMQPASSPRYLRGSEVEIDV